MPIRSRCSSPAATSYKNYHDVSGDPEAITKNQIAGAYHKWWCGNVADCFDSTLHDHIAEHQRLFRRVELNLGKTDAMQLPTDERIRHFAGGNDPQLAALYFPIRPLFADLQFAARRPAGEFAGPLEQFDEPPWTANTPSTSTPR